MKYMVLANQLAVAAVTELMDQKKVLQKDVAEKLGVTLPTVGNLLAGLSGLNVNRLYDLAHAFDTTPKQIMHRTEMIRQMLADDFDGPVEVITKMPRRALREKDVILRTREIVAWSRGAMWEDLLDDEVWRCDDVIRLRQQRGWTQVQMGEKLKASREVIRRMELAAVPKYWWPKLERL